MIASRWVRMLPTVGILVLVTLYMVMCRFDSQIVDLDPSWHQMLNYAFSHKLQFGRDIIFNIGPWGVIYSVFYDESFYTLKILMNFIYNVGLVLSLAIIFRIHTVARSLALVGGLILFPIVRDVHLFLPVILLCYFEFYRPKPSRWAALVTLLLSFDIALASLIKSSVLFMALPVLAILTLHDLTLRRAVPVAALAFIGFTILLLLAAHQNPEHWWAFYRGYFDLSQGYNADMGLPTPLAAQVIWGIGVAVIAASLPLATTTDRLVALLLGGCLAVAYKASFHRHGLTPDVAFMTLVMVGLGQLLTGRGRFWGASHRAAAIVVVAASTVVSLAVVSPRLIPDGPAKILAHAQERLSFFLVPGAAQAARAADRARFETALAAAKASFPFPDAPGPLDVFPWNFGLGMASGLPLAPRPAFQAYFATTRFTTERNAAFLASAGAPRSVLFSLDPIDNRFLALEDPLTLRALRRYYALADRRDRNLLLTRRPVPLREIEQGCERRAFTLDQPISLPTTGPGEALWARVDLEQSLVGRVLGFLVGPPVVGMEVVGPTETHLYRYLRNAGAVGFLLSPALVTVEAAQAFFDGAETGRGLQSLRFSVMSTPPGLWLKPEGAITLCRLSWSAP